MYGKRLLLVMQHGILSFKTLIIQCYVERVVTRKVKFRLASIGGSTAKKSLLKQGKHPLRTVLCKESFEVRCIKAKAYRNGTYTYAEDHNTLIFGEK